MKKVNNWKITIILLAGWIILAILFSIWDYADIFFYYFRWIAILTAIISVIAYIIIKNYDDISEIAEDLFKNILILIFIIAIIAFLKRLI